MLLVGLCIAISALGFWRHRQCRCQPAMNLKEKAVAFSLCRAGDRCHLESPLQQMIQEHPEVASLHKWVSQSPPRQVVCPPPSFLPCLDSASLGSSALSPQLPPGTGRGQRLCGQLGGGEVELDVDSIPMVLHSQSPRSCTGASHRRSPGRRQGEVLRNPTGKDSGEKHVPITTLWGLLTKKEQSQFRAGRKSPPGPVNTSSAPHGYSYQRLLQDLL